MFREETIFWTLVCRNFTPPIQALTPKVQQGWIPLRHQPMITKILYQHGKTKVYFTNHSNYNQGFQKRRTCSKRNLWHRLRLFNSPSTREENNTLQHLRTHLLMNRSRKVVAWNPWNYHRAATSNRDFRKIPWQFIQWKGTPRLNPQNQKRAKEILTTDLYLRFLEFKLMVDSIDEKL